MAARHVGRGPITVGDIPPGDRPDLVDGTTPVAAGSAEPSSVDALHEALTDLLRDGASLQEIQKRVGDAAVERVVHESAGNLQVAARRLKVTDRALQLRRAGRRS